MEQYFKDYFEKGNPVCREERQYALFLYQKLLALVNKKNPQGKAW